MNAIDKWITTATIHDEPRRTLLQVVFPNAVVPIKSIMPRKVNVPGHKNADAYMLDLDALTEKQKNGIIAVISVRFGIPEEEVRSELHLGVPILADGVSVCTADLGLFFSMTDDAKALHIGIMTKI